MALFWGIQEYIALDANNITLIFDAGYIVSISGNIFLYPPKGHPILYKYPQMILFTCMDSSFAYQTHEASVSVSALRFSYTRFMIYSFNSYLK